MKALKWFFLFFVSGFVVLAVTLYFRLGAYKPVHFEQREVKAFYILYKAHLGPYHKIGPVIEEVEQWAQLNDVPCPRSFGEYLDNPNQIDPDRLRSHGGCVLEGIAPVQGAQQGLRVLKSQRMAYWPAAFKLRQVKAARYLVARFEGSPAISPFKVYPKAQQKLQQEFQQTLTQPVIELYQVLDDEAVVTEYLFKL